MMTTALLLSALTCLPGAPPIDEELPGRDETLVTRRYDMPVPLHDSLYPMGVPILPMRFALPGHEGGLDGEAREFEPAQIIDVIRSNIAPEEWEYAETTCDIFATATDSATPDPAVATAGVWIFRAPYTPPWIYIEQPPWNWGEPTIVTGELWVKLQVFQQAVLQRPVYYRNQVRVA